VICLSITHSPCGARTPTVISLDYRARAGAPTSKTPARLVTVLPARRLVGAAWAFVVTVFAVYRMLQLADGRGRGDVP